MTTTTLLHNITYYRKLTLHEIKVLEINATYINVNLMENDFRIKIINAKEEVEFHLKEINAIKTQLVVMIRNLSWPKSKEKTVISLLKMTMTKMNLKYCKPLP